MAYIRKTRRLGTLTDQQIQNVLNTGQLPVGYSITDPLGSLAATEADAKDVFLNALPVSWGGQVLTKNELSNIQTQSAQSGVSIVNNSRQITHTNDAFFVEQVQDINVTADDGKLVDFLYKLGSGASMIRVRDLEMQPDSAKQHLNANIRLVASYQKTAPASLKSTTATAK